MLPVGYWSRTLAKLDKKLAKKHKQCLAVVWVVLLLFVYLEGGLFTVRADHKTLELPLTIVEATDKVSCRSIRLF